MKRRFLYSFVLLSFIFIGLLCFYRAFDAFRNDVYATGSTEKGTGYNVPTGKEGDWVSEVLGPVSISLRIFNALEGKATLWSLIAWGFSIAFPILFLAFIAAVAIGGIKWMSSGGNETKLQSAQKWIKNAVIGFLAVGVVFILANVITWWLGFGNMFDLAQNLATCNNTVLFEYKRQTYGNIDVDYVCSCEENAVTWSCQPRVTVTQPARPTSP